MVVNTYLLTSAVILEDCNFFFIVVLLQCSDILADHFLSLLSPLLRDGFIQINVVVIISQIVLVVDGRALHNLLEVWFWELCRFELFLYFLEIFTRQRGLATFFMVPLVHVPLFEVLPLSFVLQISLAKSILAFQAIITWFLGRSRLLPLILRTIVEAVLIHIMQRVDVCFLKEGIHSLEPTPLFVVYLLKWG